MVELEHSTLRVLGKMWVFFTFITDEIITPLDASCTNLTSSLSFPISNTPTPPKAPHDKKLKHDYLAQMTIDNLQIPLNTNINIGYLAFCRMYKLYKVLNASQNLCHLKAFNHNELDPISIERFNYYTIFGNEYQN